MSEQSTSINVVEMTLKDRLMEMTTLALREKEQLNRGWFIDNIVPLLEKEASKGNSYLIFKYNINDPIYMKVTNDFVDFVNICNSFGLKLLWEDVAHVNFRIRWN